MKKIALTMLAFLCAVCLVLPGAWAAESVKVGVVLPLTGDQAKFGEVQKLSFEMAAEEINAAGGINGKTMELLIEDDMGRP